MWHNWLALYRGTINSKLTIWSFDTWVDVDMRTWHYNEGFYMERKRDLIISWRYESLAMIRGAIKQGFTVRTMSAETKLEFVDRLCKARGPLVDRTMEWWEFTWCISWFKKLRLFRNISCFSCSFLISFLVSPRIPNPTYNIKWNMSKVKVKFIIQILKVKSLIQYSNRSKVFLHLNISFYISNKTITFLEFL
jgi:hypothetical protein